MPFAFQLSIGKSASRPRGAWTFDGQALTPLTTSEVGPAVVFVPTEHVALCALEAPTETGSARLTALAYAFEDDLAEPIEDLAFAVGAPLPLGQCLVAAMSREKLAQWVASLNAAGLEHAAIVPDALALPVPPENSWSLRIDGDRALARTADGAGFAIDLRILAPAWEAAARPAVLVHGAGAPPLPFTRVAETSRLAPAAHPIDLRQGDFKRRRARALMSGLAAIFVGALALHATIAAVDGFLLQRLAIERHSQALAALRSVSPAIAAEADLAGELDALATPSDAGFAPLLARSASALGALDQRPRLRGLAFDAREQALTLVVEAEDLGALHRLNSALVEAGLTTTVGAASLQDGAAVGELIIREPLS